MPRSSVDFIVCFAYSEHDLNSYSSYCLAISAMACAVRYRTQSDSFDGVFLLLSLTETPVHCKVAKFSEVLFQKLKRFPFYVADAREPGDPMGE